MFYFLKNNTFYLKLDDNKIFLKNNFGNLKINIKNSYVIFKQIRPFLDGKNDINEFINKISNNKLKEFYTYLIEILTKNGYLIYSQRKINFDMLDNNQKKYLLFCSNLDNVNMQNIKEISIFSNSDDINEVFESEVSNDINVNKNKVKENIVKIQSNNIIWNIYTYNGFEFVISKKNIENKKMIPIKISTQLLKIIFSVIMVEIYSEFYNVRNNSYFKDEYIFNIDSMTIR